MNTYAVGFARPDRWSTEDAGVASPWHAVEAHRPPGELDGEIELAVCGAIVQVRGTREWDDVTAGHPACETCRRQAVSQLQVAR